jgi:hypothetical protein
VFLDGLLLFLVGAGMQPGLQAVGGAALVEPAPGQHDDADDQQCRRLVRVNHLVPLLLVDDFFLVGAYFYNLTTATTT